MGCLAITAGKGGMIAPRALESRRRSVGLARLVGAARARLAVLREDRVGVLGIQAPDAVGTQPVAELDVRVPPQVVLDEGPVARILANLLAPRTDGNEARENL